MSVLPSLITDLAIILMVAGAFTILFKKLNQPVILGYIIAGMLVGPTLDYMHVTDTENIKTWADIGVIFLLFSIGLDFSFKKLIKMGATVFITSFTVILGMMSLGYFVGLLLGWDNTTSLFLGGMVSMSSTTIIIKTYEDLGVGKRQFAGLVIGMLIVEDLIAVILMVLLSTIAVSNGFSGESLIYNILRLIMFLLIWFATGIFILPTLLKKVRVWLNDETLLIVSVALCLTMVLVATHTGFSSALGAFVMGSLLAETIESERMIKVIKPLKDLFGAIFFVSVGMMINPAGLWHNIVPIALITIAVICGQIFFGTLGMVLSGQTLKIGMQAGFSLAQVGEFAFIIAQLGENLGVTGANLYPTIVAVSVITTFLTPTLIKSAPKAYDMFTNKCPSGILEIIDRLSFTPKLGKSGSIKNELIKKLASILLFNLSIITFIIIIGLNSLVPFIDGLIEKKYLAKTIEAVVIIGAMAPFMRSIMVKKNKTIKHLLAEREMNKGPLVGLIIVRVFICAILIMFVLSNIFRMGWILLALIALAVIAFTMLSKPLKRQSIAMEKHFLSNLNEKENIKESYKVIKKDVEQNLKSRDMYLAEFEIPSESPNIGLPLKDIHIREIYGVNIVSIKRGHKRINIPGGEEKLFPNDCITVVGTEKQLKEFEAIEEKIKQSLALEEEQNVVLEQLELSENSQLIGKTIKNSFLRDKYNCMIVGIERGDETMVNPDINVRFSVGDTLSIVGEKEKIAAMAKDIDEKENDGISIIENDNN